MIPFSFMPEGSLSWQEGLPCDGEGGSVGAGLGASVVAAGVVAGAGAAVVAAGVVAASSVVGGGVVATVVCAPELNEGGGAGAWPGVGGEGGALAPFIPSQLLHDDIQRRATVDLVQRLP